MNPLWLLLIIPASIAAGMAIIGWVIKLDDYDESKVKILTRQYGELCKIIEDIWPKPHGLASLRASHDSELAELDK